MEPPSFGYVEPDIYQGHRLLLAVDSVNREYVAIQFFETPSKQSGMTRSESLIIAPEERQHSPALIPWR